MKKIALFASFPFLFGLKTLMHFFFHKHQVERLANNQMIDETSRKFVSFIKVMLLIGYLRIFYENKTTILKLSEILKANL